MSIHLKPSVLAQTNKLLFGATFSLVVMLLIILFYLSQYAQANARSVADNSLRAISVAIEEKLMFYQHLVDDLAKQDKIKWILYDGNIEQAESWALNQRRVIPNAIGLALVNDKTEVLGNVGDLRVGAACRRDLSESIQSKIRYAVKVHDDVKELAHFDIVSVVKDDDGTQLGLVFASFSMDIMMETLRLMADESSNVYLIENDNHFVVSINRNNDKDMLTAERKVSETHWKLRLQLKPESLDSRIMGLFALLVLMSVLFITVLIVYSRRVVGQFLSEFDNIYHVLKVALRQDEELEPKQARFQETAQIIKEIYGLSGAINYRHKYFSKQLETDALTGLGNRRSLEERFKNLGNTPDGRNNFLVYLDLDKFKACNDTYGHDMGDEVLKAFAVCLSQHSRQSDILVRLGGDEFAAILVGVEKLIIHSWYHRISRCFADKQTVLGVTAGLCTISAGAICMSSAEEEFETVKIRADNALYQAKDAGRNTIIILD